MGPFAYGPELRCESEFYRGFHRSPGLRARRNQLQTVGHTRHSAELSGLVGSAARSSTGILIYRPPGAWQYWGLLRIKGAQTHRPAVMGSGGGGSGRTTTHDHAGMAPALARTTRRSWKTAGRGLAISLRS